VRAGDQVLRRDDLIELVVQQRRLVRRLHVGLAREQADQPRLAEDRAVGAHAAHADVVHPRPAVHRGVRARLRDHQQVAALDPASDVLVELVERRELREGRTLDVGEDPLSAAGHGPDRATLGPVDQLVLAVAHQHEVEVEQPGEEVDGLPDLLRRVPDRRLPGVVDHLPDAILHRLEVAHHEPDVVEDRADALLEVGPLGLGELAVELDVHDRLAS
jgi:hypothetical protein